MYSKEELFYETLRALDEEHLSQSQKDICYHGITALRSSDATAFDVVGYNQLHWATLCNQPKKEIRRLFNKTGVDVNVGTIQAGNMALANLTPLYIAIHIGSLSLAEFYLNKGANTKNQRNDVHLSFGPLSGNAYPDFNTDTSVAHYALQMKNSTFTLFEKALIQELKDTLKQDQDGYDSILPTKIASALYYSKKEEYQAAKELNKLLSDNPVNTDKLIELVEKKPAVKQNEELCEIYTASLGARLI